MTEHRALSELAALAGVSPEFFDMRGHRHPTAPETQRALLRANGLMADTEAEVRDTLAALRAEHAAAYVSPDVVVRSGAPASVALARPARWHLMSEDGETLLAEGSDEGEIALPGLPSGVHRLSITGETGTQNVNLIAAPARVPTLSELAGQNRTWGIVAALYGLAETPDAGPGTFRELAGLARAAAGQGAAFLGINPVHALGWAAPGTISPYSPTHRGFLNTALIAVDDASGGTQDPDAELLDYAAYTGRHRDALRGAFARFEAAGSDTERRAFADFCLQGGDALRDFAAFEHISETEGPDWRYWPAHLRAPRTDDLDGAARAGRFHMWMQWQADRQLTEAQQAARDGGMALGLYLDLAVGARLGGAESWGSSAASAEGVSLGAPPDQLSPAGQNWQLTALSPRKLQAQGYAAFRQILAPALRHCGVLRVDHALGLNRSYWLPEDGSPGGYIHQPFAALMAIIAIEAERASSLIVGEDLGLVPAGFRDTMAEAGLYGYTVLQYEKDHEGRFLPGAHLRKQSLACFGTHDTPTLRGYWEERDIDWWQKLGWIDAEGAQAARATRAREKRDLIGVAPEAPLPDVAPDDLRDHVHRRLADTPAELVAVQLDDILGVTEAQNLPGTVETHPNWRRRYPLTLPQIASSPALSATAAIMRDAGRGPSQQPNGKERP